MRASYPSDVSRDQYEMIRYQLVPHPASLRSLAPSFCRNTASAPLSRLLPVFRRLFGGFSAILRCDVSTEYACYAFDVAPCLAKNPPKIRRKRDTKQVLKGFHPLRIPSVVLGKSSARQRRAGLSRDEIQSRRIGFWLLQYS